MIVRVSSIKSFGHSLTGGAGFGHSLTGGAGFARNICRRKWPMADGLRDSLCAWPMADGLRDSLCAWPTADSMHVCLCACVQVASVGPMGA